MESNVILKTKDREAEVPLFDNNGDYIRYRTADGLALEPMVKTVQKVIDGPPQNPQALYERSCSNDKITVDSWKNIWINQTSVNAKTYKGFEQTAMKVYGKERYKPVVLAGSGPSLKKNVMDLRERGEIRVVSCLHNFGLLEDKGLMTEDDYYLSLDAGPIVVTEVAEGGKRTAEEYWEMTKNRTLIAYTGTHPDLLKNWKGRILFFVNPLDPDDLGEEIRKHVDVSRVPTFNVGGNALGACFYFARAILGAGPLIFVGADFSFDYTNKFHAWDSHYDQKFAGVIPCTDIFGHRVYTWPSYYNFKCWFDWMACGGRGGNYQLWINCTEGGILGAYPEGNIKQIIQMDLKGALYAFTAFKKKPELVATCKENPMLLF